VSGVLLPSFLRLQGKGKCQQRGSLRVPPEQQRSTVPSPGVPESSGGMGEPLASGELGQDVLVPRSSAAAALQCLRPAASTQRAEAGLCVEQHAHACLHFPTLRFAPIKLFGEKALRRNAARCRGGVRSRAPHTLTRHAGTSADHLCFWTASP